MFLNLSIIVLLSNRLIKNGYFNKNNYDNQVLPLCYGFVLFLLFFVTLYLLLFLFLSIKSRKKTGAKNRLTHLDQVFLIMVSLYSQHEKI